MKILLTGFEPFGGEKINPAWEAVQRVDSNIKGAHIIKKQLPTVFVKSLNELISVIEAEEPDVVICVGQAGGRSDLSIERVAINISDASIMDNDGNKPIDAPIIQNGPAAYFSKLPIKEIVREIQNEKLPASVSNTAGTFVCNYIMYGLLNYIDRVKTHLLGGFIHVPFIPEQVIDKTNMPSMATEDIVKGLQIAVEVVIKNKVDSSVNAV